MAHVIGIPYLDVVGLSLSTTFGLVLWGQGRISLHISVEFREIYVRQEGAQHASYNIAKQPLEFSADIPRERLHASYGQGFRGAPLQPDTVPARPQAVRPGGHRGKTKRTKREDSGGAEHV